MPKLIIRNDKGEHSVPLQGTVHIGRHPQNTICFNDSAVSKHHADIVEADGDYIFKDLNSSNGSYFNELKIKEHTFKHGDSIRVGHHFITLDTTDDTGQDVKTLVQFEQFDESKTTEVQERVDVGDIERFLPEKEVHDVELLRTDYEKLRLGQDLLQHIGLERDLDILLDTLSKQLTPMFLADRCVILLLNEAAEFETKAVFSVEALTAPISVSKSVLKEVKNTKSAVLLSSHEGANEIEQVHSLALSGISSVMCSPIIHEDEVIGAIHLDISTGQVAFTKKDLQLLGGISAYVSMAVANVALAEKLKTEVKMQAQFERLLSPNIVKQLVSGKLTIGQGGELRHVTIMFVDIRGFTKMSHKAAPKEVVKLLNAYFERVVEIIFQYGGTVDKFMGDGVMVLFGAPIPMNQQADAAMACSLKIQSMLAIWNKERVKIKQPIIPVGIGINSGEVVVGAIGSTKTMQYTCIGNAVNIASRLTDIAKAGQTIASHRTMKTLKSKVKFKSLPPQNIKGIEGQMQTYEILSLVE